MSLEHKDLHKLLTLMVVNASGGSIQGATAHREGHLTQSRHQRGLPGAALAKLVTAEGRAGAHQEKGEGARGGLWREADHRSQGPRPGVWT